MALRPLPAGRPLAAGVAAADTTSETPRLGLCKSLWKMGLRFFLYVKYTPGHMSVHVVYGYVCTFCYHFVTFVETSRKKKL